MLLYFIPRLLTASTHEVTVYDIFLYRHTLQIYSLRSRSELLNACHPKFDLLDGVLSQGVVCRTPVHSLQLARVAD